jgi:carbon-monoxide dehydrogenase medium subunit
LNPKSFEYFAPSSLSEVLDLLEKYQDEAKIIAGGQSLMPLMKMRLVSPRYLVDLRNVTGLSYITEDELGVRIGAMTTHGAIESSRVVASNCQVLSEAAGMIGDPLIRNRGTIGGSLCHADPSADYPAIILALDGKLTITGKNSGRTVEAGQFFQDTFATSLKPNEVLTEVWLPKMAADSTAVYERLSRGPGGFALVGVVVFLRTKGERCEAVRVTLSGVAPTPIRSKAVEDTLEGKTLSDTLIRSACRHAAEGLNPPSVVHASTEYQLAMVEVITRRALERCRHNIESGG